MCSEARSEMLHPQSAVEFAAPQAPTDGRERRRPRPSVGLRLARASHSIGPRHRSRHPRHTAFRPPCHPRRCRRDHHRQFSPHAAGLRPTRASGRGPEHGFTAGFGGGRPVAIPRWRAPPSARRPAESARSSLHTVAALCQRLECEDQGRRPAARAAAGRPAALGVGLLLPRRPVCA